MRQSPSITIATIGGASVLLEASGCFTDAFVGEVSDRLECLAALEFPRVTLDLRGIAEIDRVGQALLSAFATHIGATGGWLRTIDPNGRCAGIGSPVAMVDALRRAADASQPAPHRRPRPVGAHSDHLRPARQ